MCCEVRDSRAPVVRLASGETEKVVGVVPLVSERARDISQLADHQFLL